MEKYIDFIKLFHHMEKCAGTVKYIDSKLWKTYRFHKMEKCAGTVKYIDSKLWKNI